jgi:predicted S18 family serine protease
MWINGDHGDGSRKMGITTMWTASRWHATACLLVVALVFSTVSSADANPSNQEPRWREQLIRILGTTFDEERRPIGVVSELVVGLEQRDDRKGMEVTFRTGPGHFSILTQAAALSAILRTARAASLNTDSWSVYLTVPNAGITVYGESLSAMVGLTVVALARGDFVPQDRVITGTVTLDGQIGAVGGVPLKLQAAYEEHLGRVLVPEVYDVADGDWQTPFLLQVSPVGTVNKAYQALVDRSLSDDG